MSIFLPKLISSENQNGSEIVDVGQGRAGHDEIAERGEEPVSVIITQRSLCRDAAGDSTCQSVRIDDRPGIVFGSIYTIGVACERRNTVDAVQRYRESQQKLDITSAPARSGNRNGRLAARQKHGGSAIAAWTKAT